jgi:hypothetical protein
MLIKALPLFMLRPIIILSGVPEKEDSMDGG